MTTAIEVAGLHKSFGRTHALKGLDLTVREGEVHGFLGPNGSGKSTTIRILLGLLRADAGRATLLGGDPWRDAVRLHRRLAYVPGDVTLWRNLSGGEVIDLLGRLHNGEHRGGGLDPRRRQELLDRFELDPATRGSAYSKGNRQKVALVAAFASDAELLVLDEPTSGLDPLTTGTITRLIMKLQRELDVTSVVVSHDIRSVFRMASKVALLSEKKITFFGTPEEMTASEDKYIQDFLGGL